jgi:hypothetical protein
MSDFPGQLAEAVIEVTGLRMRPPQLDPPFDKEPLP